MPFPPPAPSPLSRPCVPLLTCYTAISCTSTSHISYFLRFPFTDVLSLVPFPPPAPSARSLPPPRRSLSHCYPPLPHPSPPRCSLLTLPSSPPPPRRSLLTIVPFPRFALLTARFRNGVSILLECRSRRPPPPPSSALAFALLPPSDHVLKLLSFPPPSFLPAARFRIAIS